MRSLAPEGGLRAVFGGRGGLGSSSGISLLSDLCMLCSGGLGVYVGRVMYGDQGIGGNTNYTRLDGVIRLFGKLWELDGE